MGSILLRLDSIGQETGRRVFEITDGDDNRISIQRIGVSAAGVAFSGQAHSRLDVGNGYTVDGAFIARLSLAMDTLWTINLSSPNPLDLTMVSISSLGEVVVSGRFAGRFQPPWGGPTWVSNSEDTAPFILALNPDGSHRWDRVSNDRWASFNFVEFDERGGVIVAGAFTYQFHMSPGIGGTLEGDPFGDPLFCILSASDGFVQDARAFAGPVIESTRAAAVDDFGNIVLIGGFDQGITLPRGTYTASTRNVWAVRLADIP